LKATSCARKRATSEWNYARTVGGSEARFGATFLIRCDRVSRLVELRRLDASAPGSLGIATDMLWRNLPASGTLGAADPLLDAIAFSRGRFVVSLGSAQRLVIPASPEAARSIEDCRN
jgi:hypothetical protein